MEKKKWSNPELKNVDAIHTEEGACTCGAVPMTLANGEVDIPQHHYCHHNPSTQHSGSHTNDPNPKPNDHFMSPNCPSYGKHTVVVGGKTYTNMPCCCYDCGCS